MVKSPPLNKEVQMAGNGNGSGANGSANVPSKLAEEYHRAWAKDEKDEIIFLIKSEAQLEFNGAVGTRLSKAQIDKLSYDSGVSVAAIRGWFFGETKRPRHLSTRFVLEALGVTTRRFRRDGTEIKRNW
jgi:hypothetical protein